MLLHIHAFLPKNTFSCIFYFSFWSNSPKVQFFKHQACIYYTRKVSLKSKDCIRSRPFCHAVKCKVKSNACTFDGFDKSAESAQRKKQKLQQKSISGLSFRLYSQLIFFPLPPYSMPRHFSAGDLFCSIQAVKAMTQRCNWTGTISITQPQKPIQRTRVRMRRDLFRGRRCLRYGPKYIIQ